jgi:hypothetical protein
MTAPSKMNSVSEVIATSVTEAGSAAHAVPAPRTVSAAMIPPAIRFVSFACMVDSFFPRSAPRLSRPQGGPGRPRGHPDTGTPSVSHESAWNVPRMCGHAAAAAPEKTDSFYILGQEDPAREKCEKNVKVALRHGKEGVRKHERFCNWPSKSVGGRPDRRACTTGLSVVWPRSISGSLTGNVLLKGAREGCAGAPQRRIMRDARTRRSRRVRPAGAGTGWPDG